MKVIKKGSNYILVSTKYTEKYIEKKLKENDFEIINCVKTAKGDNNMYIYANPNIINKLWNTFNTYPNWLSNRD